MNASFLQLHRRAATLTVAALVAAGGVAVVAAPASASSLSCSWGAVSTTEAWGGCSGTGTWRLDISCTWGYSGTSPWVTIYNQDSQVYKTCGWGSLRSESIEIK